MIPVITYPNSAVYDTDDTLIENLKDIAGRSPAFAEGNEVFKRARRFHLGMYKGRDTYIVPPHSLFGIKWEAKALVRSALRSMHLPSTISDNAALLKALRETHPDYAWLPAKLRGSLTSSGFILAEKVATTPAAQDQPAVPTQPTAPTNGEEEGPPPTIHVQAAPLPEHAVAEQPPVPPEGTRDNSPLTQETIRLIDAIQAQCLAGTFADETETPANRAAAFYLTRILLINADTARQDTIRQLTQNEYLDIREYMTRGQHLFTTP